MNISFIIKSPVITEKSLVNAHNGRFTFWVDQSASKLQIKQAIVEFFGVNPVSISTLKNAGKKKRVSGKRQWVQTQPRKKAVVTLKKGETISLFEQWFSAENAHTKSN